MKKYRVFFSLIFFAFALWGSPGMIAHAENGVAIDDNKDGTVKVTYSNSNSNKIAITVKKDGAKTQYNYFISTGEVDTDIPLTAGNGTYKVSVLKNIEDSRYTPLSSEEVDLKLSDQKSAFLTSNQMINWNSKNKAVKKANKLSRKYKSQYSKIKVIYKYIVTHYHYDYAKYYQNASGNLGYYTPDIDTIYSEKKGICYDISALTACMMRSVGVQTKMVTGYPDTKYYDGTQYHAWNKVYAKKYKKWVVMDVTCDMCLYEQGVKYNKLSMKKKASQYSKIKYVW